MAENTPVQAPVVPAAPDEFETRFKARLKDEYGIEEAPNEFKEKRGRWQKAEEELPQYQATLTSLINHIKERDAAPTQPAVPVATPEAEEAELRQLALRDPYEASKRLLDRFQTNLDARLAEYTTQTKQMSEAAIARREGLQRAKELVTQNWPEAFDEKSDLHKMGKQIFQREMSQMEQAHPMAFLIATERAAGRMGLPPKPRRGNSTRRADVSAQGVSRDRVRPDANTDDDKPLSARQKQVASGLGVDEKVYKEAMKNRKAQAKKQDED
jgi:hypothetical protein